MNKLKGNISNINSYDDLILLEVNVCDITMKSIIIGNPNDYSYLELNTEVMLLFKETEVVLGLDKSSKISLQNQLACEITTIEKGKLLSQVHLDFKGNKISSIITTASVDRLELKMGQEVLAMVKTNEILVAEC